MQPIAKARPSTKAAEKTAAKAAQALLRALRLLAQAGAYGIVGELGLIVVAAQRAGVSVRTGQFAVADLEQLLAQDWVAWDQPGPSGRRRLHLTSAGKAHLARTDAGDVDPFLAQHLPLQAREAGPGERVVLHDEAESPLAWLARRKDRHGRSFVDAACLEAGERLRRDLTMGAMLPRISANWSAAVSSGARSFGPAEATDNMIAARQRACAALKAVGPDFAGLLMDVCGFLKGLEQIECDYGWPVRSGKIALQLALRQLCRHYGLQSEARGRDHTPVRHWMMGDVIACEESAVLPA
jgi:hypothetical protein